MLNLNAHNELIREQNAIWEMVKRKGMYRSVRRLIAIEDIFKNEIGETRRGD